jgi:Amt family ammonium transporter
MRSSRSWRLCRVDARVLLHRLCDCLWRRLLRRATSLAQKNGYELVKFFFLLTFAAAIPAIVSGGIAERARFGPQLAATALVVGSCTRLRGLRSGAAASASELDQGLAGHEFHDFAGSVVVHAMGGWIGLAACCCSARAATDTARRRQRHPPSSIPFLALGAWVLTVGWFGFNVMSAQTIDKISGLVAVNSLMAMVGGTLVAVLLGRNDPGLRTTVRSPGWWRSARARTSCIRSAHWSRAASPAPSSSCSSR